VTSRATSLQLLLLLFVLTGVAGMHTLGHPFGVDHSAAGPASTAVSAAGHMLAPAEPMPADAVPANARLVVAMPVGWRADEHDTGTVMNPVPVGWRADEHDTGTVMNPLNVCVAVLVGGILLLLAALLCRTRHGGAHEHHIVPTHVGTGRGPPGRVRVGLTLADLSVQRT
jgi:hypothetical protein